MAANNVSEPQEFADCDLTLGKGMNHTGDDSFVAPERAVRSGSRSLGRGVSFETPPSAHSWTDRRFAPQMRVRSASVCCAMPV